MPLWKDLNNKVHDDMDGTALTLPSWKQGMVQITQAEADVLLAPLVQPLAQAKLTRIELINNAADVAFSAITAPYPKQEVATWPNQYAEAWALQSDPTAYTPTLANIALEYGTTASLIATSVLQKASAYTIASGKIIGKRKKLVDQINLATTNAQVEAITW